MRSDPAASSQLVRRSLGSPILFAIVYTSLAGTLYFALGVIAGRALGLTPLVFLVAVLLFALAAMTYVEGSSLHQDRGGSTIFARYAFNELWSFVAGWAILLDYVILVAITSFSATHYLTAFWSPLGRGWTELAVSVGIVAFVSAGTVRGWSARRSVRIIVLVVVDLVVAGVLLGWGLVEFFDLSAITDGVDLGETPSWRDTLFALGLAAVVATGLESASGLAGEVAVGRRGLKRLVLSATVAVLVVYVGLAVVAVTALPVVGGDTSLSRNYLEAPLLGIAEALGHDWLRYVVAGAAALTLIEASASAMLGLSRLAYQLSLNRQIPSAVGRLHPTYSTPYVVITVAAVLASALVTFEDLDLLLGIYAFGALLGLTIAHAAVVRLRFSEPDRPRPYRMPLALGKVPLPAALGAGLSGLAFCSVAVLHEGARYVGLGWMAFGVLAYVAYRKSEEKSLVKRVTVPEAALRGRAGAEHRHAAEFGSILVPLTGTSLDDDIVQTAGRLAGDFHDDFDDESGATIEAIWVHEVPMSLPIDARLPDAQRDKAKAALRRAKAVGEEYQGVEVATATVRARRAGQAIVEEARRRGVEAIVMAAEEPTRIRGGALLGGRAGGRESFVGDTTKYVLTKATCQVILTAPPADDGAR